MNKENQKYSNIKVIVDSHKYLNEKIFINKLHSFNDPMSMVDIEELEDGLEKRKIPYVLAQVEMVMAEDEEHGVRYKRGYVIFVESHGKGNPNRHYVKGS
jgi:hypothetical protein